jgi:catechol 2,3-dioxygenase-like lactoylglutathione lyase family enzyme
MHAQHFRVARPANDFEEIKRFYCAGLGFEVIAHFEDHAGFDGIMLGHAGFDGIMLGHAGLPYHLEFTRSHRHIAPRSPSEDNLLVFYIPDATEWEAAIARMIEIGFTPVASFNPYWDQHGKTFEDHDGYRIVLQNSSW